MLKYWRHLAAAFVACLVMVLLVQPAEAVGGQQGAFTYELKGNGTAVITKFDWSKHTGGDVYVPRMIDGYTVTEIGNGAFSGEDPEAYWDYGGEIKNRRYGKEVAVVLPDTITVIGEKAFMWTRISACNIPASIQRIGAGAFAGCCNIRHFSVSAGNQTYAVIDGVLFSKTEKKLIAFPLDFDNDEYTIPNGIQSIGDYAFYALNRPSKYSEDNVSHIDVSFSSTVTTIGDYAFARSQEINLSTAVSVLDIGNRSFEYCQFAKMNSTRSVHPQTIGEYAFYGTAGYAISCMDLSRLLSLGKGAFSHCSTNSIHGLSNSSIKAIPEEAFNNCTYPPTTLPNTVTTIGRAAFADIKRNARNGQWYGGLELVIPASVTNIEAAAFSNSEGTISFADNSSLHSIGSSAFSNFKFIQGKLRLPESIVSIDGYAFYEFKGLQPELTLPSSLVSIGTYAFYATHDTAPSLLILPDSVTDIGENVVNRVKTVLRVTPGSYAEFWASENGYPMETDDVSWLFE